MSGKIECVPGLLLLKPGSLCHSGYLSVSSQYTSEGDAMILCLKKSISLCILEKALRR